VSVQNPFGMHHQAVWRARAADRAANPSLDNWIRVATLAFGYHRRNGHASFKPGEIAEILGAPGKPLSGPAVSNAIRLAKNAGWIAEESNARCLVVPPHAVGGGLGHPNDRCPIHGATPVWVGIPCAGVCWQPWSLGARLTDEVHYNNENRPREHSLG
jgi:hypothetical protein